MERVGYADVHRVDSGIAQKIGVPLDCVLNVILSGVALGSAPIAPGNRISHPIAGTPQAWQKRGLRDIRRTEDAPADWFRSVHIRISLFIALVSRPHYDYTGMFFATARSGCAGNAVV
jgi:hypothetical protein